MHAAAAAPAEPSEPATTVDDEQPARTVGITVPLGPLCLTVAIYRHRVFALAIGVRKWMR